MEACVNRGRLSRRQAIQVAGLAGGGAAAVLMLPSAMSAQQTPMGPQSVMEVTRVAPDVYMWRNVGHNSLFIIGGDGVLVVDGDAQMSPGASDAYKAIIRSFTDKPVRWFVYSHDHADHATGGNVFADTATFISHERARPKIAAQNNPRTPEPTVTFQDRMTIDIGGASVELIYTGRNHSDNSIIVHYAARRLLYAVDFIPVRGLPFRNLGDSYANEWVESLRWIEDNLDFDVLVPGHGTFGTKQTVTEVREYLLDLMAAIRAARSQGLADNSEQMVASVRAALMPKYGTWASFGPYLPENIEGIIRIWNEGN